MHLSDAEREMIAGNINQNVTNLAKENPDITFYYFFTPYSATWWMKNVSSGYIYKQIEAEEYIIELILEHDNIKLFSFNNRIDIVCDLNNYKDSCHYGQWINSLILHWMHEGKYQITKNNYKEYLEKEMANYSNLDYYSLNNQIDYENDFYAAALLNQELTGAKPIDLLKSHDGISLQGASIVKKQHDGKKGIECIGSLQREPGSKISVYNYIINTEYIGATVDINSADKYNYLVFYGKKVLNDGQPTVYIINDTGEKLKEISANYHDIDNEWHQYVIDITEVKGNIHIIFNGGYIDNTGSLESNYIFSDIMLY